MSDVTRDDFVVSFKPHTGYDAPLLAMKDATAAGLADKVAAAEATALFATIANADKAFKAAYNLGVTLGATPVQHPNTVQAQQAAPVSAPAGPPPGMTAPTCPHGTKAWKTGGGNGKREWKAWMCPAPKGAPDQCPPEWVK
ncbi:hypothetical protein [Micromonospora avicenniae]|uniref:hypothetical protein n=1 Tax=Micromonospora avicenniae TaxID=1198245 RepID=UPI0033190939